MLRVEIVCLLRKRINGGGLLKWTKQMSCFINVANIKLAVANLHLVAIWTFHKKVLTGKRVECNLMFTDQSRIKIYAIKQIKRCRRDIHDISVKTIISNFVTKQQLNTFQHFCYTFNNRFRILFYSWSRNHDYCTRLISIIRFGVLFWHIIIFLTSFFLCKTLECTFYSQNYKHCLSMHDIICM